VELRRRQLPLDDFSDHDVADAVFAMRHLSDGFGRGAFGGRRHSRFAWGLAVLHRAGIIDLRVLTDIGRGGGVVTNGLITVDVRLVGKAVTP